MGGTPAEFKEAKILNFSPSFESSFSGRRDEETDVVPGVEVMFLVRKNRWMFPSFEREKTWRIKKEAYWNSLEWTSEISQQQSNQDTTVRVLSHEVSLNVKSQQQQRRQERRS